MTRLTAQFKGLNFKRLVTAHGEKFLLGTIGLVVFLALLSTTWAGYKKKPNELLSKATEAGTRLKTGDMTEEMLQGYKPSIYQSTAMAMFVKMNNAAGLSRFAYDKPMSFRLYPRQEPRGETSWPAVQHLLADSDVMVIGIAPDQEFAEGTEGDAPAEQQAAPRIHLGANPLEAMEGRLAGSDSMRIRPRGLRYVAIRGIVNTFEIGRAIQKANHLETLADGIAAIDVVDFKIERQTAIAGDNPWPDGTWQEVSLDRALEVLSESGQAADLVNSGVTNPLFTMPLPSRLDGDYTTIISHPILKNFQLTREQRELEQRLNAAFLDAADEFGIQEEQSTGPRGFVKYQVNINSIRNQVMESSRFKAADFYKKAGVNGVPEIPAKGGPIGGQAEPIGGAAVGYLMLFRFLDFDVTPGEAYRYRVKLEFKNLNLGLSLDLVKEASVSEGDTRFSEWSEPTAPVVVKPDTNIFLARVDKRMKTRGEAQFHIFQWDPGLGTYIDSKKLMVKHGQFVGGLEESARLDLGIPSLETKTVLFASRDFLLDTSLPPVIHPAESADLNLGIAERGKELDLPAEAAVLDAYGELRVLDSMSSKQKEKEIEDAVLKERKPYEALRDAAMTEFNPLTAAGEAPSKMTKTMLRGPASNLKRGKNGKATKSAVGAGPMGYGSAPSYPSSKSKTSLRP